MTEARKPTNDDSRPTMADVSHVHRYDPGASTRFYSRGPVAFTDGGEEAFDEGDEEVEEARDGDERQRMADVSHTPPTGDQEVNRVFERGREGTGDHR